MGWRRTDEVVEDTQAVGILAVLHVKEGTDLGRGERDVLVPQNNLQ